MHAQEGELECVPQTNKKCVQRGKGQGNRIARKCRREQSACIGKRAKTARPKATQSARKEKEEGIRGQVREETSSALQEYNA